MGKKKRSLSVDDQKAVDVILNHAASKRLTAVTEVAAPARVGAVTKLLSLLNQLPVIEPPVDLLARTMDRIDQAAGRQVLPESASITASHMH